MHVDLLTVFRLLLCKLTLPSEVARESYAWALFQRGTNWAYCLMNRITTQQGT